MTRRHLLDVTSKKKRDTMVPATIADGLVWLPGAENIVPDGGELFQFFWPATARSSFTQSPIPSQATRESKSCYMVGLKQHTHITTGSDNPWEWRQIVFSTKGLGGLPVVGSYVAHTVENGYMRGQRQAAAGLQQIVNGALFRGTEGVDWIDHMIAPLDRTRMTILSDRTRTLHSGNGRPVIRKFTDYFTFNKNLLYDDQEDGQGKVDSRWSVTSKVGMGDVFVIDFFRSVSTAGPTDLLTWASNATLFWHER